MRGQTQQTLWKAGTETAVAGEIHTIENGGHGFYGQPFEDAVQYIEAILSEHMPVTQ